jgi:hypothetical protein
MRLLAALGLVVALLIPGLAQAQVASYDITDPAIQDFYDAHGGAAVFGDPISREFTLVGTPVQIFQNTVLRIVPDGSVQVLQLTDPSLMPYTHIDGLTVPAADPSVTFVAPTTDQPNYNARLEGFLQGIVAPQIQPYYDPDVWGLPTSFAVPDPNNPSFLYQRFENGILFYDATSGTVRALPLGQYFKAILTRQGLPPDLAADAASSPFLGLAPADAF